MTTQLTPGWRTSEFYLHLLAVIVPPVAAALTAAFAPHAAAAVAATAAVTAVAGNYAAGQYSDARTSLKHAVQDAAQAALPNLLPLVGQTLNATSSPSAPKP